MGNTLKYDSINNYWNLFTIRYDSHVILIMLTNIIVVHGLVTYQTITLWSAYLMVVLRKVNNFYLSASSIFQTSLLLRQFSLCTSLQSSVFTFQKAVTTKRPLVWVVIEWVFNISSYNYYLWKYTKIEEDNGTNRIIGSHYSFHLTYISFELLQVSRTPVNSSTIFSKWLISDVFKKTFVRFFMLSYFLLRTSLSRKQPSVLRLNSVSTVCQISFFRL